MTTIDYEALEPVLLTLKDIGFVRTIEFDFIDPPDHEKVHRAVGNLRSLQESPPPSVAAPANVRPWGISTRAGR